MTRHELVHLIACELDKPSIYMGGPSPGSRRRAETIADLVLQHEHIVRRRIEREAINSAIERMRAAAGPDGHFGHNPALATAARWLEEQERSV